MTAVGRLAGKSAFITGSASGIGRAIAILFASEGAPVVVADCDETGGAETAALIEESGGEGVFLNMDVTDEESVRSVVGATIERFGRLDVLVNNAGIVLMAGAVETTVEDWDRVQAVNLRGYFLCSKHAIPQMQRQGGGAIVNIASIGALVGIGAHAAYNASKAGVLGLSRQMAVDYGSNNVRVNCVCPTATDTPLIRGLGTRGGALRAMAALHPLRRLPEPIDIAYAALFLASDEARCITGAVLPVDSGWTAI